MVYENEMDKKARLANEKANAEREKKERAGQNQRSAREGAAIKSSAKWSQKHSNDATPTIMLDAKPVKPTSGSKPLEITGFGWSLLDHSEGQYVSSSTSYVKKTDATEAGHIVIPIVGNGVSIQGVRKTKIYEGDVVKEVKFPTPMDGSDSWMGNVSLVKQAIFGESEEDKSIGMSRGFMNDTVKTYPGQLIEMDDGRTGVIGDDYRVRVLTAQEQQARSKAIADYNRDFRSATTEQAKWNNLVGLATTAGTPIVTYGMRSVMKPVVTRQIAKEIGKQKVVYRYLTEGAYQDVINKYKSVAGYTSTGFTQSSKEAMSKLQVAEHWKGAEKPTGKIMYRVEIPVDKLKGFSAVKVKGDDKWGFWWEKNTWSYPEHGEGGWLQFKITDPIPLKDLKIIPIEKP